MEDSFFEYRDNNDDGSDTDTEVIDDSISLENSFATKKSNFKNNKTVFVAESEESITSNDSKEEEGEHSNHSKNTSGAAGPRVVCSSDDDKGSGFNRKTQLSCKKNVVLSSSDDEVSPEMIPRRPPLPKSRSNSSSSFIGRKVKKRMILIDSDTENSIIIEQKQNNKLKCLKDTPLKVEDGNMLHIRKALNIEAEMNLASDENDSKEASGTDSIDKGDSGNDDSNKDGESSETEDDGHDEDQMVMSRATRMSIMGVVPKNFDSDDSDFIQSDDSNFRSRGSCGSTNSLTDLPNVDVTTHKSTEKPTEPDKDGDTTNLTCSPFSSPLRDITQELNDSLPSKEINNTNQSNIKEIAVNNNLSVNAKKSSGLRNKVLNRTLDSTMGNKEKTVKVEDDDDVTIIDSKPEIIALSSDDEYEEKSDKKPSLTTTKNDSISSKQMVSSDMRQFLVPPSYPNQVVYVKKHVRENELNKLNSLKEDLHNIRHLLDNMEMDTLPDGGRRLVQRLSELEEAVRKQGDKVAGMVVEPDKPTAADIANDGFGDKVDKGLTWDEIQKASNAVQPRMFGKQAMATHMAERTHILDRLRDLHESLASRPPETELGTAPKALRSQLMPHQLHALAWLRWRETQRPSGGILADDMGLGKTITMISLILSDKEKIDDENDEDDEWSGKGNSKLSRGGTLVVCPATLIQQWAGEVTKHCVPHSLSVCMHHGAARSPHPHRVGAHDVVVTTYNILQRDNEKNGVLMRINWRRIILDEAHIVRNYKSATSAAVSALRGRRRWCLTGTPVQNKDLDLFALLKFLKCSPFDDLTMWKKWIDNKSLGGQDRMNTVMSCILLRRTKVQLQERGQLACLPERTAHHRQVTLTTDEMNVYQKVLVFSKTLFAQFLHQRAEKQAGGTLALPPGKDTAYAEMHKKMIALQGAKPVKSHEILVLLLRLRQVCCHCGLIAAMLNEEDANAIEEDQGGQDLLAELNKLTLEESQNKSTSEQKEEQETTEEGTSVAEAIRSVLSVNNPVFNLTRLSSKIKDVMDCLRDNVFKNKGDKAVVVSQWTAVLRLVEQELRKERVRCVTLSGQVPVPARPPLIQAINDPKSDVKVMLLSLCAGGVGLNLVGANHLLLLDPHWNPQLEEQAQDRIYRVGQTKHCHVYRFMCVDTVEQSIRKLQEAKLELAANVLTGAKNTNKSKLSIEDLKLLFNM